MANEKLYSVGPRTHKAAAAPLFPSQKPIPPPESSISPSHKMDRSESLCGRAKERTQTSEKTNKALDALIEEHRHTPEAIFGEKGLVALLTKTLVERALGAELTYHLKMGRRRGACVCHRTRQRPPGHSHWRDTNATFCLNRSGQEHQAAIFSASAFRRLRSAASFHRASGSPSSTPRPSPAHPAFAQRCSFFRPRQSQDHRVPLRSLDRS